MCIHVWYVWYVWYVVPVYISNLNLWKNGLKRIKKTKKNKEFPPKEAYLKQRRKEPFECSKCEHKLAYISDLKTKHKNQLYKGSRDM